MTTATVDGFPPPTMPSRVMVRSYRDYTGAADAVSRLAGDDIPPERVTIVARGLEWAEDISPKRAVRDGAAGGALLGALIGLALWALGWSADGIGLVPTVGIGALIGVLAGAAVGLTAHWWTSEDPDVPATGRLDVAHYDVLVDEDVAGDARAMLAH